MKRGFRLTLLTLLLLADLLLLPAVARLPGYVLPLGSPPRLTAWQQDWLRRPGLAALTLIAPETPRDLQARQLWLLLQLLMAGPVILLIWPQTWLGPVAREGVPPPDPSGAYGTARWRSLTALRKTLLLTPIRGPARLGIMVGVDREHSPRTAYLVPPPPNNSLILVIGSPGSGKTRRLVLPNLYLLGQATAAGQPASIILTDPKGELYSYTADYFRGLGFQVVTLNLLDPRRSHRYNPLSAVAAAIAAGDFSAASEAAWDLAHAFATVETTAHTREDPFWQNASESVIAAAVLYVASRAPADQRTMTSVYRMITELGKDGGADLDNLFEAVGDYADPARLAYGVTALSEDRTRAGILTTAAVNLRLFADPVVADMTAASDYDLASIGQRPTVVYLLLPDDKSSRNAIAAMHLAQTYTALTRLANSSPGGRLPIPVFWVLDEFANIGRFRDFDKMISVMRGRGMGAMIVLQALQQLEARYGRDLAQVIAANCDTWLFLRTNDQNTAKQISEKLGKYTIRTRTGSASARRVHDWSTSQSDHLTARDLLTPDELLRWPHGQVLLMQAGCEPAKLALADISEWPASLAPGGPPPLRPDPPPGPVWIPTPGSATFASLGSTAIRAEGHDHEATSPSLDHLLVSDPDE
ncbi:VirD4-like conjugal transfer protein, CD1115 family [Symbiobacterium terraclitae]|uniref:VirD4-like conjugal transfer protein, CD1115 family n=1 Tax=Symbiobacterium terraclitae TaxID=557451 RepID=UPI0035B550CF